MTNKPIIKIHRDWQDSNQTLGTCKILGENNLPLFVALSLERGWQDNQQNISCIPCGVYKVVLELSDKYEKLLWEIKDVPNRSECKFHSANYWYELEGCIAPGLRLQKINSDQYYDITKSTDTMKAFHTALKPHTEALLIITSAINVK